jgi:hypothetical protein
VVRARELALPDVDAGVPLIHAALGARDASADTATRFVLAAVSAGDAAGAERPSRPSRSGGRPARCGACRRGRCRSPEPCAAPPVAPWALAKAEPTSRGTRAEGEELRPPLPPVPATA